MNIQKLFVVSLLSTICSLNPANAGKFHAENMDVPETVRGIPMNATITLMSASPNAEYTYLDIDLSSSKRMSSEDYDSENHTQIFNIPNGRFPEMYLNYLPINGDDIYTVTPISCRINVGSNLEDSNDRTIIDVQDNTVLMTSLSYQLATHAVSSTFKKIDIQ